MQSNTLKRQLVTLCINIVLGFPFRHLRKSVWLVEFLHQAYINSRNVGQLESNTNYPKHAVSGNHQPIIEEPPSPEPEPENAETKEGVIEDFFCEDPDEIPTFNLNIEEFTQNLKNYMEANLKMLTCQWHWLPLPLKLLPFQLQSSRILLA